MTRPGVAALALAAVLAGCTLVGGVAGGTLASQRDHQEDARRARDGEPVSGESTIIPAVFGGAAIGMLIDAVAITFLLDQARTEPPQLEPAGASR